MLEVAYGRCAVHLNRINEVAGWPVSTLLDPEKWVVVVKVGCPNGVVTFEDNVDAFPSEHLLAQLVLIAPADGDYPYQTWSSIHEP